MISELMVLLLATVLMAAVVGSPISQTRQGAVLMAIAMASAALAVAHQWAR